MFLLIYSRGLHIVDRVTRRRDTCIVTCTKLFGVAAVARIFSNRKRHNRRGRKIRLRMLQTKSVYIIGKKHYLGIKKLIRKKHLNQQVGYHLWHRQINIVFNFVLLFKRNLLVF